MANGLSRPSETIIVGDAGHTATTFFGPAKLRGWPELQKWPPPLAGENEPRVWRLAEGAFRRLVSICS
jgi:hypothetical protein